MATRKLGSSGYRSMKAQLNGSPRAQPVHQPTDRPWLKCPGSFAYASIQALSKQGAGAVGT